MTEGFPSQRDSNAESVSMSLRHLVLCDFSGERRQTIT